ncbi:hypothetical protein DBR45_02820 [Pseudomonas sp. HMWF031]|nr:hypothetical protein DBR45_02820 [Pseudomonas sp. HMWF031]
MPNRKPWLEELRRQAIVLPIQTDARTKPNKPLGRDVAWLFNYAIGGGQADFDQKIEDLTPLNRVMLYAYLNQKAHVDELICAFDMLLPDLERFKDATVIDIGCGPFTAGLSLANVVGDRVSYRYFGIDHSSTMCAFGENLALKVLDAGEFHECTQFSFHQNIETINFGQKNATEVTIFVLSYLLASETINVKLLVDQIVAARMKVGLGPAVLLYTNTGRIGARRLYPEFMECLEAAGFKEVVEKTEVFTGSDKDRSIHYALFVSPAVAMLPLSEF